MKKILLLFTLVCTLSLCLNAKVYSIKTVPNVFANDSCRHVTNPDGVLSEVTVMKLDSVIAGLGKRTSAEIAVVALDSIDSDENEFATNLFGEWGIGKNDKDNGLLLLLVKGTHRVVIRTGYGLEGVLPDIVCGRIIRNNMVPYFKKDDYDNGLIHGMSQIGYFMTTPEAVDEIMSEESKEGFWESLGLIGKIYFSFNVFFLPILLIYFLSLLFKLSKINGHVLQYQCVQKSLKPIKGLTIFTLGVGLPFLLFAFYLRKRYKNAKEICPNCHIEMHKFNDAEKSACLSDSQKFEESIGAVEYEVWKCGSCNKISYIPISSGKFEECPKCHVIACQLVATNVVRQATRNRSGEEISNYKCRHCQHGFEKKRTIPRVESTVRNSNNYHSSGGHGGGSYGGGRTGGGGASGGW